MTISSFLARLWAAIKKMFDSFDDDLRTAIHIGVTIVENLKDIVDSPAVNLWTEIIPGELDDRVADWLREQLPIIVKQLKLAEKNLDNDIQIISQAATTLKDMDGNIKSGFLHNLSILIAQTLADGKLNWSDGVYLLQWYYQHRFKRV